MDNNETYILDYDFYEGLKDNPKFLFHKNFRNSTISDNGYVYYLYNPYILFFLTNEIPITVQFTLEEKLIDGKIFMEPFFQGYRRASEYFDTTYSIPSHFFYGDQAKSYLADLKELLWVSGYKNLRGWDYCTKMVPIAMTKETFDEYGYYMGLVRRVIDLTEKHPTVFKADGFFEVEQAKPKVDSEVIQNDFIISTIDDFLKSFNEEKQIPDDDYIILINAISYYFKNNSFPKLDNTIRVIGRRNKKILAWSLYQVFRFCDVKNNPLPLEYVRFVQQNISIFQDLDFDDKEFRKSTMYKYLTTKAK